MKRKFLILATMIVALFMTVSAETKAIMQPHFLDNWSVTLKGGVTTPLSDPVDHGRGMFGLEVKKQITPVFGLGLEGEWTVNTSRWPGQVQSNYGIDNQYVGVVTTTEWLNLFNGYSGDRRLFELESVVGIGWGHAYSTVENHSFNTVLTKFGFNFNFNLGSEKQWTLAFKPAVVFNLNDDVVPNQANFDVNRAALQFQAGVTYHFANKDGRRSHTFCNKTRTQHEVDVLMASVNQLKAEKEAADAECANQVKMLTEENEELAARLKECMETPDTEVEVSAINVPVQFKIASATIEETSEATLRYLADEMKSTDEKYTIVGYASTEGNTEFNQKLSERRAESVKKALVKYGVPEENLETVGEGPTTLFSTDNLNVNRVVVVE